VTRRGQARRQPTPDEPRAAGDGDPHATRPMRKRTSVSAPSDSFKLDRLVILHVLRATLI
jgi:hypothetical protein